MWHVCGKGVCLYRCSLNCPHNYTLNPLHVNLINFWPLVIQALLCVSAKATLLLSRTLDSPSLLGIPSLCRPEELCEDHKQHKMFHCVCDKVRESVCETLGR